MIRTIPQLLHPDVQDFIRRNEKSDLAKLALGKNPFHDIPFPILLDQISGLGKAREKLPRWHLTPGIVYPPRVSMEQASSQAAAAYKSQLVSGSSLIDLTGGFGVDDAHFAQSFEEVIHCEIDSELSVIVAHNLRVLGVENVQCFAGNGFEMLMDREYWDCIYIDPSRRHDAKGKVFMLRDCSPDVPSLLPQYFSRTNRILLKTSPILDITAALADLTDVAAVHIVALRHEVREILFDLQKGTRTLTITTVNLETGQRMWTFDPNEDIHASVSQPLTYLYEPNAAIMKSGGFGALARDFGIRKLHLHSHLFTSDEVIDFPGRVFKVDKILPFSNKGQKELSALKQANVAVRNFPLSVAEARKRLKLADGGDVYCFLTTGPDEQKIALICSKIGG